MIRKILLSTFLASILYSVNAQVGINILNPDSSAVLQLESTDRGFALPRLTTSQMNAIQNPLNSLMVYNTEDSLVHYWNGDCWLKAYQKNCRECEFTSSVNQGSAVIDRTTTDTATFEVTITKLNGVDSVTTVVLSSLPNGIQVFVENPNVDSVGITTIKVYANIWATPGSYPLIIQSVCGQNVFFQGVNVIIEPCLLVDIAAPLNDVDLQSDFSLPGVGTPVCVIVHLFDNVEISSTATSSNALTWGNMDPVSHVGFLNEGFVYAKGGDGAALGNLLNLSSPFQDGDDGGDALELTCRTTFDLQGGLYGGGGGGGSVGTSIAIGPFSIPIIGTLGPFILLEAGVTGGGGSSGGLAQTASGSGGVLLGPSLVDDGTDATVGPTSIPGVGGILAYSIPLSFGVSVVNIAVTPQVSLDAGDGGGFGQQGGGASGNAGANVVATASVPFIGTVTLFSQNFNASLGLSQGGAAGNAIEINGNTILDLVTPNYLIKGPIQP
ncbi:MAG: hypothetical protein ACI8ZX_001196 [Planctomycetota bacterium]